jgi:hypothetical protein
MRRPPLWAKWLITIAVFAIGVAAIVIAVHDGAAGGSHQSEAAAVAEANRVGRVVAEEDQAPHTSALASGVPALAGLERAITRDVRARISHGELTGPLQSVRCRPGGPARAGRRPFDCTVHSAGIEYPFLAVLDERALELTWCKVDPSPLPGNPPEVPVSPRCQA